MELQDENQPFTEGKIDCGKEDDDDNDEPDKIPTHHLEFCPLVFCPLGFILHTMMMMMMMFLLIHRARKLVKEKWRSVCGSSLALRSFFV